MGQERRGGALKLSAGGPSDVSLPLYMPAGPAPRRHRPAPGVSGAALALALAWLGGGAIAPLPARGAAGGAGETPAPVSPAMSEATFEAALASEELSVLELACQDSARFDQPQRLRLLRDRLMAVRPVPQPLPVVLANANALISCLAPEAALGVLDRYGPGPGLERQQWLIQQWRAANAGLNHRRASEALRRLAAGNLASLETMALPVRLREDGSLDTRAALDVLAGHLEVMGRNREAAEVLLAGRLPGVVAAERLRTAARLLGFLPLDERNGLLETALDQAAAAGAWGLAAELLDVQLRLQLAEGGDAGLAYDRRLRLSQRIDDAYTEWLLRSVDPDQAQRSEELERQLRSPRSPGGHAASEPVEPNSISPSSP